MLRILSARIQQGFRTIAFPAKKQSLPARFMGRPQICFSHCQADCAQCQQVCPTGAISLKDGNPFLDLGKCLFCGACQKACPQQAIVFTQDHRLAVRKRQELVLHKTSFLRAQALDKEIRKIFGRSLRLRQVSAGGCNGCELDTNVLTTVVFDLGRFGIQFVASPRHADGILVTGPVTENMKLAVQKTYDAMPSPKIVIAVGACAISGGPYAGHAQVLSGVDRMIPVDLYIPGCPPHPLTILDGLVRLLGRIKPSNDSD